MVRKFFSIRVAFNGYPWHLDILAVPRRSSCWSARGAFQTAVRLWFPCAATNHRGENLVLCLLLCLIYALPFGKVTYPLPRPFWRFDFSQGEICSSPVGYCIYLFYRGDILTSRFLIARNSLIWSILKKRWMNKNRESCSYMDAAMVSCWFCCLGRWMHSLGFLVRDFLPASKRPRFTMRKIRPLKING